jgi:hypothetical protein
MKNKPHPFNDVLNRIIPPLYRPIIHLKDSIISRANNKSGYERVAVDSCEPGVLSKPRKKHETPPCACKANKDKPVRN